MTSYDFDEIVVGAGLTGLVYANVMAAAGKKVAVVEKHTKPGGYASNFSRKREFVFDCSLHKITGFGKDGNLSDALSRARLVHLVPFYTYTNLTTFSYQGEDLVLPAEGEKLVDLLVARFSNESENILKFFDQIRSVGRQNYMLARMSLGEFDMDPELFAESRRLSRMTTYDYLTSLFQDRMLVTMFCSLAINLGVEAFEADALYFLHFAFTFFFTEKRYVKGSSQALSNALADELNRRGGELFLSEEVKKILSSSGRVDGCETRRFRLNAPRIIWTGAPNQIAQNIDSGVSEDFASQLSKLEPGLGAFIVYLGLSCPPETCGLVNQDYLIASSDYLDLADVACESDLRYEIWPLSVSNYHLLDESYGYVVQLEILDQPSDWFDLSRGDYKIRKSLVAEKIIERFSKKFPLVRDKIKYIDISTPRTNQKFTNSTGGSAFGYKPVPKRNSRFLQRPPLEGLQFVGTWVNGAGYEPAMCLGFTAATLRIRQLMSSRIANNERNHSQTFGKVESSY